MSRFVSRFLFCLPVLTVIGLMVAGLLTSGCAEREYHYWQRKDPTSAIYLNGPKAQAFLEDDIAECTHEVIELDKLETVRENHGNVPASADNLSQKAEAQSLSKLPDYDVPAYVRSLRVEHKNFHDFDGCMTYKGWERVKYVAPATEAHAKEIYNRPAEYTPRSLPDPDMKNSAAMQAEQDELKRR